MLYKQENGSSGYLKPKQHWHRKTLILDLDETLIHTFFEKRSNSDFILDIEIEETVYTIFVQMRPGVIKFLQRMSKIYELVVFTASLESYAKPIMKSLELEAGIKFCKLYWVHCSYINKVYIKDLSKLGRPLKNCVIVDNNPDCYTFDTNNAIPILSWFDDLDDKEL